MSRGHPNPGPPQGDDNDNLDPPKHLKADNPGPNPRPDGCKCTWTPLSLGWSRGVNPKCMVH